METPKDKGDQPAPKSSTLVYICGGCHFVVSEKLEDIITEFQLNENFLLLL